MYLRRVKRGLSILIAFSMLACSGLQSFEQLTSGMSVYAEENTADAEADNETSAEAVEISTLEEFMAFRDDVNNGNSFEGQTIVLMSDIDMSEVYNETSEESWIPIGDIDNQFNGTFDGNSHKINNVYLNSNAFDNAVFGYVGTAGCVKNLGIGSGVITGKGNFAGIASINDGTVEKCYNECDIKENAAGQGTFAGIVATNNGVVTECYNTGNIENQLFSVSTVGGIVAINNGTVSKCYNSVDVNGLNIIGGIAGQNNTDAVIEDCYNVGNIGSKKYQTEDGTVNTPYTGGIAGSNNGGKIVRCYHAGMIAHDFQDDFTEPLGDDFLGTIAGRVALSGTFADCYYLEGSEGDATGAVENADAEGVTVVSEEDLANAETFGNWDFENVWTINSESNIPTLKAFEEEIIEPVEKTELDVAMFTAIEEQHYSGEAVTPKIVLNSSYEGVLPQESDYTVEYYNNTEIAEADGTTGPYAEITATENGNFTGSVILTFSIASIPEPIKAISLGNKSWTTLDDEITFESYKSNLDFSITYEDEYKGTTAKIEFYISENKMTADDLAACDSWVEYNDNRKPVIRENVNQIIYAKFTDNTGKVSYINSNGINVDSTAPVVSNVKVENNKLTFNVDDPSSTYYYVIFDKINAFITPDDVIKMAENPSATDGSVASGTKLVTQSGAADGISINLSLTDGKNYFAYVVARDDVDDITVEETVKTHNVSEIADNIKITQISNADELKAFRDSVNAENNSNDFKNQVVELVADIDIDSEQWGAIGNSSSPFNGVFKGNGYSISNINVNGEHCQGLFGYVGSDGVIMDLGISSGSIKGQNTVGSIVGQNLGTVMNCYNGAKVDGLSSVGGIVGQNAGGGKVLNCYNTGVLTSTGDIVGGIAGSNLGDITNSYYLETSATGGIGGSDAATDVVGSAEGKTDAEFKSGEITWLLQGNQADQIWGQAINADNYPKLSSNSNLKVVEVNFYITKTNTSKTYINSGNTVTTPDAASTNTNYEFVKWSDSNEIGGNTITNTTPIIEDTTLYAIYKENFTVVSDNKRSINAIYGTAAKQKLSDYITYSGNSTPKTNTAGSFTYEIVEKADVFNGTIEADTLTITDTPVDEYTIKITATEKPSIKEVSGIGFTEYGAGTATFDVAVKITQGTIKITKPTANRLNYTGEAQELIKAGVVPEGAKIEYKLGVDGEYKETIPTAINAGNYVIYYKVDGGKNYTSIAETNLSATINKARPTVVVPTAITGLTYDGEAHEVINPGSTTGGELQYALENKDESYSTEIPKIVDAGRHAVFYRVKGNDNFTDIAAKSVNVTIAKAKPEVVAPTAVENLVYDGEVHELVNAGTTSGGEIRYSTDNGKTYTTDIPVGTNAGKYDFQWRVIGGDNYTDTSAQKMSVTIEKADYEITLPSLKEEGVVYTGFEQELINEGICNDAVIEYSLDGEEWSQTPPTAIYAGNYTVSYRVVGDDNHNSIGPTELEVTVEKGEPNIVLPEANDLTYTGEAQKLITAGTAGIMYSLEEEGEYSEDIPTAVNAGTYNVYYKMAGDENTKDIGPVAIEVTIKKATPVVTISEPQNKLTYNGEAQSLILASVDVGNILYSTEEDGEFTEDIPTGINAGTYTIYYKVEGNQNYNEIPATAYETAIEKATPKVEIITDKLVYNGSEQPLIKEANVNLGELKFGFEGDDGYSSEIPTAVNAGTYNVVYLVEGTDNYNAIEPTNIQITIEKADITVVAPEAKEGLIYNGVEQDLITEGTSDAGVMMYSLSEDGEYSIEIPSAENAGTYTVYYKVEADENYIPMEVGSVNVVIGKATPNVTVTPEAKDLVYNDKDQELITAGESNYGDILYSLVIDGEYSTEIPTAKNAGNYTVYYKIDGDQNYNTFGPVPVNVIIEKASITVVEPSAKELTFTGLPQELINAGESSVGLMQYSLTEKGEFLSEIPTAIDAGTYTVYYKVDAGTNYVPVNGSISVTIKDAQITSSTSETSTTATDITTVSTSVSGTETAASTSSSGTETAASTSASETETSSSSTETSASTSESGTETSSSSTETSASRITSNSDTTVSTSSSSTKTSASRITSNSDTTASTSSSGTETTASRITSNSDTTGSTSVSSTETSSTEVPSTSEPETTKIVYLGDANSDGLVNPRDCAYIARAMASPKPFELPDYADYNQDKVVNIRDAAAIARELAKPGPKHWIKFIIVIRN